MTLERFRILFSYCVLIVGKAYVLWRQTNFSHFFRIKNFVIILVFQILHTLHVCHKNQLSQVTFKYTYTQTLSLFRLHDFACMRRHTQTHTFLYDATTSQLIYLIYSFIRAKEKFLLASTLIIQRESHKCERDRLCLSIFIVICVSCRISVSNVSYTCVLEEIYYLPRQKCIKDAKIKCETFIHYDN